MTDSIAAQVAALPKTPTPELKQMWRELFDREPPGFSRNYLISRLAYRTQELAYGGLKPATRAKLEALADALDPKAARKRVINGPVVGTQLIREWRGVEHRVTVLADGFEWEGRTIARELNAAGEVTKWRACANGARGGKPWTKGAVYKVLANRVYLGKAVHKGVAYPGEHAAIVDQRTWGMAHAVMAEAAHRRGAATEPRRLPF